MSERIEIRSGAAITAFVDEYVKRISRVIDEQALAKVEQQLADYGYVKVIRCRDCVHMLSIDLSDYYGNPEPNLEVCKRVRGVHLDAKPDGFCAWGERKEVGDD